MAEEPRQAGAEIKNTEEMIEAGMGEFLKIDNAVVDLDEVRLALTEAFKKMLLWIPPK